MDKLIEKIFGFIMVFSFLVLSFTLFNINMVEYKVKSNKIEKDDNFVFRELVSTWLVEHTKCKDFGIYVEKKYSITECKKDNETIYYVDKHKRSTTIAEDYFYKYNGETNEFFVYSKNPLIDKVFIKNDFTQFLGIEFDEAKIKEKTNSYALIKKDDSQNKVNLINEESPTFLMLKKD